MYSLGALGFELATGSRLRNFAGLSHDETARQASATATRPLTSVRSAVRGGLETVFGKALRSESKERYRTAAGFGADLRRILRNEPIVARPATRWYRVRMFTRRHRALVGGVAGTLATLPIRAIVSVGYAWEASGRSPEPEQVARFQAAQFDRIEPRKMRSQLKQGIESGLAKVVGATGASVSADLARAINTVSLARHALLSEIFEPALAAATAEFSGQPRIRARVVQSIVSSMEKLGLPKAAEAAQLEVLELREQHLGPDHALIIASVEALAKLRQVLANYRGSAEAWKRVAAFRERVNGPNAPATIYALGERGSLVYLGGDSAESLRIHRGCYERAKSTFGAEHERTLGFARAVSDCLNDLKRPDEARGYGKRLVAGRRRTHQEQTARLGKDNAVTIEALFSLAEELVVLNGWKEESLRHYRDAVARARRVLGPSHSRAMDLVLKLAEVAHGLRLLDEARACDLEHLAWQRRVAGDRHPATLACMLNVAMHLCTARRFEEAVALLVECLASRREVLRGDDWRVADTAKRLDEVRGRIAQQRDK